MNEHTAEPWQYDDDGFVYGPEGEIVASPHVSHDLDESEMEANGFLIAAAPETAAERDRLKEINAELLAAAEIALQWGIESAHGECVYCQAWLDSEQHADICPVPPLRAAIARARGQS